MHYTSESFHVKCRFPKVLDLRELCIPTNNQHNDPNCVGYSVGGYIECFYWSNTNVPHQVDAQLIYGLGRQYKCTGPSGTRPEYCFSSLIQNNYISGEVETFTCDKDVVKNGIMSVIHSHGVFVGSFQITDEWLKPSWFGSVIKEKKNPKRLGGHCVLCCGYNDVGLFIQNSWGYQNWGSYGFATLHWNLVLKQFDYGTYVKSLSFTDKTGSLINESEIRDSIQNPETAKPS